MADCIFCTIASGVVAVPTVYENEQLVAFVDLHPLNPGHTLVIPKHHYETFIDMPSDEFGTFMTVAHTIAEKVHRAYPSQRLGFLVKGFDVPHAHLHLIPQHSISDIVNGKYGAHAPPEAQLSEREAMAERIKAA